MNDNYFVQFDADDEPAQALPDTPMMRDWLKLKAMINTLANERALAIRAAKALTTTDRFEDINLYEHDLALLNGMPIGDIKRVLKWADALEKEGTP